MNEDQTTRDAKHANLDPITKEPGAHPVGVGVGAAVGGMAAGAAAGTMAAGPIGTAIGAAVGAVVGGLGGKAVAEKIDPTIEAEYWRANHEKQVYAQNDRGYTEYAPAYQTGWEGRSASETDSFEEAEPTLSANYGSLRGDSGLEWDEARPAARAAWDRAGGNAG